MGEAIFEVAGLMPERCEALTCRSYAVHTVRLIGSAVLARHVCRRHIAWAKSRLIACEMSADQPAEPRPASEEG